MKNRTGTGESSCTEPPNAVSFVVAANAGKASASANNDREIFFMSNILTPAHDTCIRKPPNGVWKV